MASGHVNTQQQMERALEECSRARAELERELNQARSRAESASEDMQHFVYAVSHDLRQPLRSVLSYAQLLQRQFAGDAETAELAGFIVDGATEMSRLIDDVLKYSRISTSPSRETLKLNLPVQMAWLKLGDLARGAGAELKAADLSEVAADETQMVQLFEQLFSNALKFHGPEPPTVEVSGEEEPDCYAVTVRDNGIGIDPQYHEMIFAPFKRLHGSERPGSGLGLAIAKKIVLAHEGRIWVESDGRSGSAFKFTLPY